MATIFSNYSFDQAEINLNRFYVNAFDATLFDNYYEVYNDVTYTDLFVVDWSLGGNYYASVFGGPSISYGGGSSSIIGTVTGYLETVWDGATYVEMWGIQDVSINAASLYAAAMTVSSEDEYSIGEAALSGNDLFYLSGYSDRAYGLAGNDRLYGFGGGDILNGGSGNDTLAGGTGIDSLSGDSGKDYLLGGSGADRFFFKSISDSAPGARTADVINDFERGKDKIDLSAIDAFAGTGANDYFIWRGGAAFRSGSDGEIRYQKFNNTGSSNDYTMVWIDNDNDTGAEMAIRLTGLFDLTYSDFIM